MAEQTYRVIFQPLAEGGYMASVPALPEIQAFGDTLAAAKAGIRTEIEGVLASYGEFAPPDFPGDPVVDVISVRAAN